MSIDIANSVGLVVCGVTLLVVCKCVQMVSRCASNAYYDAQDASWEAYEANSRCTTLEDRVTKLELSMEDTKPKAERPARIKPGKADKVESVVAA
jgi:hypothetical protein